MSDIELEIDDEDEETAPARNLPVRRIVSIGIKTALGLVGILGIVVLAAVAIEIYLAGGRISEVAQNLNSGQPQRNQTAHRMSTGQSWLGEIAAYADMAAHALDSASAHAHQLPGILADAQKPATDPAGSSAPGEPSPIHQAALGELLKQAPPERAAVPTTQEASASLSGAMEIPDARPADADMTPPTDAGEPDPFAPDGPIGDFGDLAATAVGEAADAVELALAEPGAATPAPPAVDVPAPMHSPADEPAADVMTTPATTKETAAPPATVTAAIQPEWPVASRSHDAPQSQQSAHPKPSDNGWRVQLAALSSREAAEAAAAHMQLRYRQILADAPLSIARADLPKGTFFRIQAGPLADRAAAATMCRALQARQQDCFVVAP